ncbi:hypothetical protein AB0C29_25660 [Actinoplanes sp. NPDC048791]|uniref:hypothetical protein n=1 Tax=Actinoplanes sp. NPDC048791 TaxID=3154623 RepID=UPI0033FB7452
MTADSVADVKREILVRHLEAWAPAALHRARRATYVHGYADAGPELAQAALRVFVDQSDLVRGRELTMLALGEEVGEVGARLSAIQQEAGAGAGLTVQAVSGGTDARLAVALKAVGAGRVPLLAFLDATAAGGPPLPATVAALTAGKPAEAVIVVPAPGFVADDYRAELRAAGFPLVAAVELATGEEPGQVLVFATQSGKNLEGFKDALWAVDEYAGVRYRDPGDPERHLIDISLSPHPGPLRRELLAHLAAVGEATVTDLRTFALTETVYRAADATRVLQALLTAGSVTRRPEHGRLGGDVVIAAA